MLNHFKTTRLQLKKGGPPDNFSGLALKKVHLGETNIVLVFLTVTKMDKINSAP